MKEVEKIKRIQQVLAIEAGKHMVYSSSWSADFCRTRLEELRDEIIKELGLVSFECLTGEELRDLGFGKWDEADSILLIPIWLYPFIAPGQKLWCFGGKPILVREDYTNPDAEGYIDNDQRFGYLAYGVKTCK